jgi:hypothetical protein
MCILIQTNLKTKICTEVEEIRILTGREKDIKIIYSASIENKNNCNLLKLPKILIKDGKLRK